MEMRLADPTVVLPASTLAVLADRCGALGPRAISALREVGREAGARMVESLAERPHELGLDEFWERLDGSVRAMNLGSLHFEPLDDELAAVAWYRLPEAGDSTLDARSTPGCHLATGMLGGILDRAGGRPVAVLEVACRAGGAETCWFLIGSRERLLRVHERLEAGATLRAALSDRQTR